MLKSAQFLFIFTILRLKMAETCDDLSEYLVEEELSRDVESLKAILASDADSEDHTRGGKNCNSIGGKPTSVLNEMLFIDSFYTAMCLISFWLSR